MYRRALFLFALSSGGCVDSDATDAGAGSDSPRDDFTEDEAKRCNLEDEIRAYAGVDGSVRMCGYVLDDSPAADFVSATHCVLAALDAGVPFSVTHEEQGVDSRSATAYAWSGAGPVHGFRWDNDPGGGGGRNSLGLIMAGPCERFEASSPYCLEEADSLCVRCVNSGEAEQVCPKPRRP
jgi:hypothetical protein